VHLTTTSSTADFAAEVAVRCIDFGTQKIKEYKSHLKPLLRRCINYQVKTPQAEGRFIFLLETYERDHRMIDCLYGWVVEHDVLSEWLLKGHSFPVHFIHEPCIAMSLHAVAKP
jgi:hypothetical protein